MSISDAHRRIDFSTWPRRRHFDILGRGNYPYIGLTVRLDVTRLVLACREADENFFTAMLHSSVHAMNSIENFRYRVVDGEVLLYDVTHPSFTVFHPEDELFYFANVEYTDDYAVFKRNAVREMENAVRTRNLDGNHPNAIFVSCLPWLDYVDMVQPLGLSPNDSVPRLFWGRYVEGVDGRLSLSFSITGHHGLFDGIHVARLVEALAELIDRPLFPGT
jgi:Chloramphenicol O-acetyltransferase